MNEEQYIKERLDGQIKWYSMRSRYNQRGYKILRTIEISTASLIPFLSAYTSSNLYFKYIVGAAGVLIVILLGISNIFKFYDNWIHYRAVAEALKREKYLYLTLSAPYGKELENRLSSLVNTVETLISKENYTWVDYTKKEKEVKQN